jgi:hypothetical protein
MFSSHITVINVTGDWYSQTAAHVMDQHGDTVTATETENTNSSTTNNQCKVKQCNVSNKTNNIGCCYCKC